ncbi:polysaccharide deacetylase family protein [Arthrospiribacter ruber]|uniref:ChbG/HpnK family deacetylase n=1 Tax=Arthrospiribacter ruber TaxID=2487934 RepID=A0A951MF24_9BACT|nr:polysaccharide deacetylase family protein [Arthrospiribacter ruber]MBW3468306.1 ChbG/HpnK family deacetylase [Arthrospiribacter ruber]
MNNNKLIIGLSLTILILIAFNLINVFLPEKFLIIHTDDFGLSDSHNRATIEAMREGLVTSASLMVPCPKRDEAIDLWKENRDLDIGIHLTFTSEWENYKWGGVAESHLISSILDKNGKMYPDCASFLENADISEIEIEIRAQIEYVLNSGLRPSHLDAHMSCLFRGSSDLIFLYVKLAQEYNILPMLTKENFKKISNEKYLKYLDIDKIGLIDNLFIASESKFDKLGMARHYEELLNGIGKGFNVLLIHTSYEDDEMWSITGTQPYWGTKWRADDFKYFTSLEVYKSIYKNDINLINWKVYKKVKSLKI